MGYNERILEKEYRSDNLYEDDTLQKLKFVRKIIKTNDITLQSFVTDLVADIYSNNVSGNEKYLKLLESYFIGDVTKVDLVPGILTKDMFGMFGIFSGSNKCIGKMTYKQILDYIELNFDAPYIRCHKLLSLIQQ